MNTLGRLLDLAELWHGFPSPEARSVKVRCGVTTMQDADMDAVRDEAPILSHRHDCPIRHVCACVFVYMCVYVCVHARQCRQSQRIIFLFWGRVALSLGIRSSGRVEWCR